MCLAQLLSCCFRFSFGLIVSRRDEAITDHSHGAHMLIISYSSTPVVRKPVTHRESHGVYLRTYAVP